MQSPSDQVIINLDNRIEKLEQRAVQIEVTITKIFVLIEKLVNQSNDEFTKVAKILDGLSKESLETKKRLEHTIEYMHTVYKADVK